MERKSSTLCLLSPLPVFGSFQISNQDYNYKGVILVSFGNTEIQYLFLGSLKENAFSTTLKIYGWYSCRYHIADKFCLLHVHENLSDLQVPFIVNGPKLLFIIILNAALQVDDSGNICRTTYLAFNVANLGGTIEAGRTIQVE